MFPSPSGFRFGLRQLFQVVLAACLVISPVSGQSILGSLDTKESPAAKLFLENAAGPDIPIGRATGALRVIVEDQSFTTGTDTVSVTLRCSQSGDVLVVKAIETDPGRYASQSIPKNEDKATNDASLNCKDKDIIRATYTDPNFGTGTETSFIIHELKEARITFPKSMDDTTASGPLVEGERDSLYIRVDAYGKRVDLIDSILMVFITAQGEREAIWMVETGPHTQVFLAQCPIAFISTYPIANNETVEGRIFPGTTNAPITLVAGILVDGVEIKKEITLVPAQSIGVRPGGSAENMLWWKDGVLGGQWLHLHRPRSIACFDARGAYLGEGRASGDPTVWRLPTGTGVRFVRIRALDGARLDRILLGQ